jgi:oligopeptide transport system substrate-binding protein
VVHHVQEDRSSAVQRFRSGEFDVVRDFPSGRAEFLPDELGPGAVHTGPFLGLTFVAVNHRRAALGDVRVREALALGLHRRVLAEQVLGSGEQPAMSLVPPGTDNYGEPARYVWAQWDLDRRVEAAQTAMRAAGYGPDRPLELVLRYAVSENDRRVAVALQAMWKQIWVEAQLVSAETAVHYARLQDGDFDLGLASWLAVYSDPQTFTLLLESKTAANNFGAYSNPEYDALTDRARATPDIDARARALRAAEALALEEQALIPIYHHAARNLVAPAVGGWQDNALDVHRSRYLRLDE